MCHLRLGAGMRRREAPRAGRAAVGKLRLAASIAVLMTLHMQGGTAGGISSDALRRKVEEIAGASGTARNGSALPICRNRGILPSEGLALMAAAELAGVDVVIESGTASGASTEMLARHLQGRDVDIFTIDSDKSGYDKRLHLIRDACERLKKYPRVACVKGDSNKEIPRLLGEHQGKRIGIFVDGPKQEKAVKLCTKSLAHPAAPAFCAIHDIAMMHKNNARIKAKQGKINKEIKEMPRHLLSTDERWYRSKYAAMDGACSHYPREVFPDGYGLSVIGGRGA